MKNILIFLSTVLFAVHLTAKSNLRETDQTKKIVWVNEISSATLKAREKSIFESLKDFIFGEVSFNISRPFSLDARDPQNIVILDQENRGILNISKKGGGYSIQKVIEPGKYPSLVAVTDYLNNQRLFTDSQRNRIYRLNLKKNEIIPFAEETVLSRPTGIVFDAKSSIIWVVETGKHRLTLLDTQGKVIKYIGKRGTEEGEFNFPTFISIDKKGLVYVVDSMNFRIQIFNSDGSFKTMFGKPGDSSGYIGRPKGIATDSFGNIYVVDALFHVVQVFDNKGNLLTYFGGQGQQKGRFWLPEGIFIDKENKIYVADSYNSRIQVFQLISEKEN